MRIDRISGVLVHPKVLQGIVLVNVLVICGFCFLLCLSSFLCLLCPMLPVSLDFPFLIAISVFANVYFNSAH